jgi:hypothetical protein
MLGTLARVGQSNLQSFSSADCTTHLYALSGLALDIDTSHTLLC